MIRRQELKQLILAYESQYPTTYSNLRNLKGSLDKLIDFLQDQSEQLRVQQFHHTIRSKTAQDTEQICTPEDMLKEDILRYCKNAQNNINLTEMYMKWLDVRADISFKNLLVNKLKPEKKVIVNFMRKKLNENMTVNKPCTKGIQELWKVLNKEEIKRCKIFSKYVIAS